MNKFIILDVLDFLKSDYQNPVKPILYSVKGVNIWIDKNQLKKLRNMLNEDTQVVHNPSRPSRLTLLDLREMLKTLNCQCSSLTTVDTELFRSEKEFAPVFRAEEFITYHVRSNHNYKIVLNQNSENFELILKYYQKHIPVRLNHFSTIEEM